MVLGLVLSCGPACDRGVVGVGCAGGAAVIFGWWWVLFVRPCAAGYVFDGVCWVVLMMMCQWFPG